MTKTVHIIRRVKRYIAFGIFSLGLALMVGLLSISCLSANNLIAHSIFAIMFFIWLVMGSISFGNAVESWWKIS